MNSTHWRLPDPPVAASPALIPGLARQVVGVGVPRPAGLKEKLDYGYRAPFGYLCKAVVHDHWQPHDSWIGAGLQNVQAQISLVLTLCGLAARQQRAGRADVNQRL